MIPAILPGYSPYVSNSTYGLLLRVSFSGLFIFATAIPGYLFQVTSSGLLFPGYFFSGYFSKSRFELRFQDSFPRFFSDILFRNSSLILFRHSFPTFFSKFISESEFPGYFPTSISQPFLDFNFLQNGQKRKNRKNGKIEGKKNNFCLNFKPIGGAGFTGCIKLGDDMVSAY